MKLKSINRKVLQNARCPFLKVFNIDSKNQQTSDMVCKFKVLCPFLLKNQMKETANKLSQIQKQASAQTLKVSQCPHRSNSLETKLEQVAPGVCSQTLTSGVEYQSLFHHNIDTIRLEGRYREFKSLLKVSGSFPYAFQFNEVDEDITLQRKMDVTNTKEIVLWCSNDYLGMGQNKVVTEAAKRAIDQCGIGAGGTRNIGGTSVYHVGLEKELASLHGKQGALLMTSGYVANQAGLTAIKKVLGDLIFLSDEKNHASLIDGMRSSGGERIIFKHNDIVDLENKLKLLDINRPKLIVFESVYSMNGSMAPIKEICELAKKYNALTFLDEVHAVGLYGSEGAGLASQLKVQDEVDFISGTLGKAFGCSGGYIAGDAIRIDCIRSNASNFIFTTSLPPVIAAASHASVRFVRENQELRDKLQFNTRLIKKTLEEHGIPVIINPSHITPVIIGDASLCKKASEMLLNDYNVYIQAINYPTVARGQEILRISPTPIHTPEMILHLAQSLVQTFERLGIPRLQNFNQQLSNETEVLPAI